MDKKKIITIVSWTAKISGGIVLIIALSAAINSLIRTIAGKPSPMDTKGLILYFGILSLSLAYKWPLLGGAIATTGIIISGFIHPLILAPGILFMVYWFINRPSRN